jgi:hypothetical protein
LSYGRKMGFAFDTSPSRPTAVVDDNVIERLAQGKLPSHRSAWGLSVSPPKPTVTRANRDKCATFPRCPKSMVETGVLSRRSSRSIKSVA